MTEDIFKIDSANESLIIESAMADPDLRKRLVHEIQVDEFLVPIHEPIWKALRRLTDDGLAFAFETARRMIIDEGGGDDVLEYMQSLTPRVVDNIRWHVETLKWDARRARVIRGPISNLIDLITDSKATQQEVQSAAKSVSRGLNGSGHSGLHNPSTLYREYKAARYTRANDKRRYGIEEPPFDENLSNGFRPGQTIVSAGLSGSGKSTIWASFAIRMARRGYKVLYCTWEMGAESTLDLLMSQLTLIPIDRIVNGELSAEDERRVDGASKWIVSRIVFMKSPFMCMGNVRSINDAHRSANDLRLDMLETTLAESGCNVVIYDLWERMLTKTMPDDVASALFRLQHIHREYGVAGVVIHQLKLKDVEKREDKRPTRESIKGSAAYVEVADLIIGVHRDGQFKNVEDNTIETICLKQRLGRANWSVRWDWRGETGSVDNPIEVPYDPGLESAGIADFGFVNSTKRPPPTIGRR